MTSWQYINIWIIILCREGIRNSKLEYDNHLIVYNINKFLEEDLFHKKIEITNF